MNSMTAIATCCILLVIGITAQAQTNTNPVSSKITDVTVFMSGAQITETAALQLKEGENILRITGLTAFMDPNSIQVEGNPNFTIMSVKHQINYSVDEYSNPVVKVLKDSLDDAKFKQQEIIGLKNVVEQERALLESNRKVGGNNSTLVVEDLQDMANFYRKRFQELEYRWIELNEKERKNNQELTRLQNKLNSMNARKGANPSEVLITLVASKAVNTQLKFSYVVRNAGWYPVYDLRAEDVNSNISFVYRAKVYQSTGRDWEKVNLTISTGNPTVGGQIPTLYPWYVDAQDPIRYNTHGRSDDELYKNATPSVAIAHNKGLELEEVQVTSNGTSANFTTIQNNTVNAEFKIVVPYDIPSDNQQYDVTMQAQSFKAQYNHITIPKLDNDAFLRAQITDWTQYALLPGESNIYFKGTFVGKGFIDPSQANDTLNLSLGRDRSISVKRELLKEYSKTTGIGNKQQTTRAFEITVQNNKSQTIQLTIEDQLPVSQSGDVEVSVDDVSGAQVDGNTGKVTWNVTLAPGETVKKQLRFKVKYPKKKYVLGL
ncbi:MAG TPA: DUF4139 domain-containing protein [Flavobacteriales bacterium]